MTLKPGDLEFIIDGAVSQRTVSSNNTVATDIEQSEPMVTIPTVELTGPTQEPNMLSESFAQRQADVNVQVLFSLGKYQLFA